MSSNDASSPKSQSEWCDWERNGDIVNKIKWFMIQSVKDAYLHMKREHLPENVEV